MTTMMFDKASKVLLLVHSEQNPSDAEWDAWIARIGRLDFESILIVTKGGGPSGAQRAKLVKAWKSHGRTTLPPVAAITDSNLVRGMLTAFRWLGLSDIVAFSAHEMPSALHYLSVARMDQSQVLEKLMSLQNALNRATAPVNASAHP